jgi:hypothetical protein
MKQAGYKYTTKEFPDRLKRGNMDLAGDAGDVQNLRFSDKAFR